MKPRWVVAKKEFAGVFTERTILLAVVIQVFVAGFSSFLVVGLSALFDPSTLDIGNHLAVVVDEGVASDPGLMSAISATGMRAVRASSAEDAMRTFRAGQVDAAILSAPDPERIGDAISLRIVLPDGDLRATLSLVQIKDALESYERELRDDRSARLMAEPLYVDTDVKAGHYSFVYSLLIPLLVFLPVVLSGALSADSLTEEVQRGTLPLLLASPATPSDVVEGKLMANVAIAPVLTAAWFGLLGLNGLTVSLDGALVIMLFATAIAFLMGLLACVIALATRDRNKAHVIYAAAMFLLLAVSLVLPVSPVNAVALLAAGSPSAAVYAAVVSTVALAVAGWAALRYGLRRSAAWMIAG